MTVVHNTSWSSSDYLPSEPPDNHPSSDAMYWRGWSSKTVNYRCQKVHTISNCAAYMPTSHMMSVQTGDDNNSARTWNECSNVSLSR